MLGGKRPSTDHQLKTFACTAGCSDCCIRREFYPSESFGKIGVLLLPEEKARIERLGSDLGLTTKILPRIALGQQHQRVIAFQLMGSREDGDHCPFLNSSRNSRHGGKACSIYEQRPLACRAYPVIDMNKERTQLDVHCRFCSTNGCSVSPEGLEGELEALAQIKAEVNAGPGEPVWRYATATGSGSKLYPEGWIKESSG